MKLISPIAQSFYVENPAGIFATKIELYFRDVDPEIPLKVQLRPIENGKPSNKIYPFSEIIAQPGVITGSTDATVSAVFQFEAPVYLEGEKFHSVVIIANSDKYTVWTSRLGESDVSFSQENNQVIVSKQPLSGGIFKSQNNDSWVEEPYEDLTFSLYRASFISSQGSLSLTNPTLRRPSNSLPPNPLEINSRKIKISLSEALNDSGIQFGNTISQPSTNSTGNYISSAGSIGTVSIVDSGLGYEPGSYSNITLVNVNSDGYDATANIDVDSLGNIISVSITNAGFGYLQGDILTATDIGTGIGRNFRLSVSTIASVNQLILDNVQGQFNEGSSSTIQYTNSSGSLVNLNGSNVTIPNGGIIVIDEGLDIRVSHVNHGMHSTANSVVIGGVVSDIKPTKLSEVYNGGTTVSLESVTDFSTFENQTVSTSNPGYFKIGGEIFSYTGVSSNTLTGVTRDIDSIITTPVQLQIQTKTCAISTYNTGQEVYKYELNGISLRRINREHLLEGSSVSNPIGLDYYTLRIDTSERGIDRSSNGTFKKLYFSDTKSCGGKSVRASSNIQFESATPNIKTTSINGTNINAKIRTISGTSVSGEEDSFEDQGFEDIDLSTTNYFSSPRLICSAINENRKLSSVPGNKSLNVDLELTTIDSYISPMIDLDRSGLILSSNRVDEVISDYSKDPRVSSFDEDPSAFTYATNLIELEAPASSIKVILTASVNVQSDIRALYAIQNEPSSDLIYYPFPGYKNLNNLGQIINLSDSDGTSDSENIKTDSYQYLSQYLPYTEYEYTIDNIASFKYFSIKLIGASKNQAFPPRIKNLRVLALA